MDIYNQISNAMYDLTKVKLEMKFKEYCKSKGMKQYKNGVDDNSYAYDIAMYGDNSTKSRCVIYNGNQHPAPNDTKLAIEFDESKQKKLSFVSDGKVIMIMDNRDDGKALYQEEKVVKMIYDHKEFFDSINIFVEA